MHYRKFIYTAVLSLLGVLNYSSLAQELPKVIPPSPEATQLAKFVDMPVSLYSGTPNISVPIYTINSSNGQVPISLSYHAKGIQVNEKASRVGLGWSLNAGGVISRQVRERADEFSGGYYYKNDAADFTTDLSKRQSLINDDLDHIADFYPDLFLFNFMGYSGKFIIDHTDPNKQPVIQSYSDLKILRKAGGLGVFSTFEITTPDGTKYTFGEIIEGTNTIHSGIDYSVSKHCNRYYTNSMGYTDMGNCSTSYPTSWYLVKIETITNDVINFKYQNENVTYFDVDQMSSDGGTVQIDYSRTTANQNQLKEISFKNGKVKFIAINNRQDLSGSKTLDSVHIINSDSLIIKKMHFNYKYTTSGPNTGTYLNIFDNNVVAAYDKKRLFLDYVEEVDLNDSTKKIKTSFEYNSIVLPNRHSNSKDNWGYFNNKNNPYDAIWDMADRVVDPIQAEAGILKKIHHPTGGFTAFEYEHNKVVPPSFFNRLLIKTSNPQTPKFVGLFKDPSLYDTITSTNSYFKSFELTQRAAINFTVSFDTTTGCAVGGPASASCLYDVYITNENKNIIRQLVLGNSNHVNLLPGKYFIRVKHKYKSHDRFNYEQNPFQVYGNWLEDSQPSLLFVGGKRIKKIIKDDGLGNVLQKEYLYTYEDNTSSGKTFSIPLYYDIIYSMPNSNFVGRPVAGGSGPLSQFAGNNIGYSRVTEIEIGGENRGKTVHTFTDYEETGPYYKFPYHIPDDIEWTRGMPLTTDYYGFKNGIFEKVKSISNKYLFYNNCASPHYVPDVLYYSNDTVPPSPPPSAPNCFADWVDPSLTTSDYIRNFERVKIPFYKLGAYYNGLVDQTVNPFDTEKWRIAYFIGGRMNLQESTEINYFDNGLTFTKTKFKYNSPNHYQLKEQELILHNDTKVTKYFYPSDIEMASNPLKQYFIDKNIVTPLVIQNFNTNGKLSETETAYKLWGSSLLAPEILKSAKGPVTTLEERVKYNNVDSANGNPQEVEQVGGMKISYLWGYNKTQPVAKLENIAYAAIPISLINAIQSASNTGTESDLLTALDALRSSSVAALQNAMITTYTYKPLIGVSTITDPKGDKITYHYDGFNRLKYITDKEGHVLKQNEYHYATQP